MESVERKHWWEGRDPSGISGQRKLFMAAFFVAGALCGLAGGLAVKGGNSRSEAMEVRSKGQYRFINPLLECSTELGSAVVINEIEEEVGDYIKEQTDKGNVSKVGVYYRDLNNGPSFGINEKEPFVPASLIKVPLMMTYLKAAEEDPLILGKKVRIERDSDWDQNIKPEQVLKKGEEQTIEALIEHMITYSDNVAFEILAEKIDQDLYIKTYGDLGVDVERANGEGALSAKGYSAFFRILFNASYLNEEMSEKALQIMTKTSFKDGLIAGVPTGTMVSHKFGERGYFEVKEKQLHDCGIIYNPKKPYLLCVMTRGEDFSKLTAVIKEISRKVYQFADEGER